jgi:hypothetical protein
VLGCVHNAIAIGERHARVFHSFMDLVLRLNSFDFSHLHRAWCAVHDKANQGVHHHFCKHHLSDLCLFPSFTICNYCGYSTRPHGGKANFCISRLRSDICSSNPHLLACMSRHSGRDAIYCCQDRNLTIRSSRDRFAASLVALSCSTPLGRCASRLNSGVMPPPEMDLWRIGHFLR